MGEGEGEENAMPKKRAERKMTMEIKCMMADGGRETVGGGENGIGGCGGGRRRRRKQQL